jgi:hypothetical protein
MTPGFSKDTSPNAIKRWQQAQTWSREQMQQDLLRGHAQIGTLLSGWWRRLCERNSISFDDPILATPATAMAPALNDAITEFDSTFRRMRVELAIATVRKKLGWKNIEKYKCVLLPLCNHLERTFPRPLPQVPKEAFDVIPADIVEAINKMSQYTAMNCAQFNNVPPPALLNQILNQVWAADQDESRKEGIGLSIQYAKIIGRCSSAKLEAILKVVKDGRGAVCTSFAGAAASLLIAGRRNRPYRVEMISGPNHCFCLVNRVPAPEGVEKPGDAGATLFPAVSYWGPGAIIVDAWAGALGHQVFYKPKDYPKVLQVYLTLKLLQHYDSGKDD